MSKCQVRSGFEHLELEIRILIKFQLTRSAEEALEKGNFQDNLRAAEKPPFIMVWYTVYVLYIYIYIIYTLYHLGYKTKSWNLKMVWCLLFFCGGWSFFQVGGRLAFSAVARTMNAPAVFKVIHDYGLLIHFMSTSDETSNVFQVTLRCLEDVLRFMLHLTSRLHCRG